MKLNPKPGNAVRIVSHVGQVGFKSYFKVLIHCDCIKCDVWFADTVEITVKMKCLMMIFLFE